MFFNLVHSTTNRSVCVCRWVFLNVHLFLICDQIFNFVLVKLNKMNVGQDMNFRVALQYEFTHLGLDDCLERLRHHESVELAVQVSLLRMRLCKSGNTSLTSWPSRSAYCVCASVRVVSRI